METTGSRNTLVAVWVALVAATAATGFSGADHGLGAGDVAALGVIAVAFVKVWLVGRHFMELRTAPPLLRGLFDGYVVVVATALAVVYVVA
jgi:hypothetical protein